jgi:hypothetical protein
MRESEYAPVNQRYDTNYEGILNAAADDNNFPSAAYSPLP